MSIMRTWPWGGVRELKDGIQNFLEEETVHRFSSYMCSPELSLQSADFILLTFPNVSMHIPTHFYIASSGVTLCSLIFLESEIVSKE